MSLLDYHWIPTSIGSHEIQANAAGVFSVVSLTVSAGEARQITTSEDTGFTVQSGVESDIFIEISDSRAILLRLKQYRQTSTQQSVNLRHPLQVGDIGPLLVMSPVNTV